MTTLKKKLLAVIGFSVLALPLLVKADEFSILRQKSARKLVVHGSMFKKGTDCDVCHAMSGGHNGLVDVEEWTCFICHSSEKEPQIEGRKSLYRREYVRKDHRAATDILSEFEKPYAHPTKTVSGAHSRNETLPETDPKAPRHAECVDCHHYHEVSSYNKFGPLKVTGELGEKKEYKKLKDINLNEKMTEYQLCFNCHSDSANLPLNYTNKRAEFNTANPSFHPVLAEGKNTVVPSLKPPYTPNKKRPSDISTIKCGDCHGNNDTNGPKGPHGSVYQYILVRNYSINDEEPESEFQYSLCYMCHDRTSILRNDSFKYHSLHIQGNTSKGTRGTSCHTCHDPHGSIENKFLISFNKDIVFSNVSSGQLQFISTGTFSGECYLSCHDVSHNPKKY